MKKKQLHIVNKYFYPVIAGIETALLETYSRFNMEEWEVTVHTSTDTLTDEDVLPEHDTIRGIKIIRYHTNYDVFLPKIPWKDADALLLNNFSLVPIFPVVVHAFFLKLFGRKRTTILLAPHGGFTPMWDNFTFIKRLVKKGAHFAGGFMINRTIDGVHAVAEWEKEQMVKAGIRSDLITVVPNGVEEVAFNDKAPVTEQTKKLAKKAGKYFVMISRIHPLKNLEAAINAFQYVKEPYNLLIMGKLEYPMYYMKLKSLVDNLNLDGRVIFADQVTDGNKYYLLRHAVAMIHTSKYEVDPIAVKEGLSQGLVCICSDNTGTARLIKNGVNGFLVPTNDHIQIAKKIMYVAGHINSPEMVAIKKHNLGTREDYRWAKVSAKMEKLFLKR